MNGKSWKPKEIDVQKEVVDCEASPNESVEALKCYSFADLREKVSVFRVIGDQIELGTAYDAPEIYGRGKNLGEWTGDGRWLLFTDSLFNVETLEFREVIGLPGAPRDSFRAASPDLEKIVYEGACFYEEILSEEVERIRKQTCEKNFDYSKRNIRVVFLWVIEAKTGETKLFELGSKKYDWLSWNQHRFANRMLWLGGLKSEVQHFIA